MASRGLMGRLNCGCVWSGGNTSLVISVVLVTALFGLMIGSAINALVWRLYVGRSWVKGRSVCPDCDHRLAAKDLVPVVSWLWLRGKCRYCGKKIHWQYPVVEVVTALLFGLSAWALLGSVFSQGPAAVAVVRLGFWLVMLSMMIVLAVYDARWMLLPDRVMLPLIGVAVVYSATMAVMTGAPQVFVGAGLAAIAVGAAFYGLVAVSRGRAMGGGDIKLVFAMGLMLGLKAMAVALLLAFNVAAIVGVVMIVLRRRGRKDHIPFGPFLVGGAVAAFLYGQGLVGWYLRINGL